MAGKKSVSKRVVGLKYAKLNAVKFGMAGGIVAALCVFFTTLAATGGYAPAYTKILLDIYGFVGYKISFFGAVLGAFYSFIDGFLLTFLFAWIYNRLL